MLYGLVYGLILNGICTRLMFGVTRVHPKNHTPPKTEYICDSDDTYVHLSHLTVNCK